MRGVSRRLGDWPQHTSPLPTHHSKPGPQPHKPQHPRTHPRAASRTRWVIRHQLTNTRAPTSSTRDRKGGCCSSAAGIRAAPASGSRPGGRSALGQREVGDWRCGMVERVSRRVLGGSSALGRSMRFVWDGRCIMQWSSVLVNTKVLGRRPARRSALGVGGCGLRETMDNDEATVLRVGLTQGSESLLRGQKGPTGTGL